MEIENGQYQYTIQAPRSSRFALRWAHFNRIQYVERSDGSAQKVRDAVLDDLKNNLSGIMFQVVRSFLARKRMPPNPSENWR